jgi:CDP-glucose 4,6-dehydratase
MELVATMLQYWAGSWIDTSEPNSPHEAGMLHLQINKAHHQLGWKPCWGYANTIERTVNWYKAVQKGANPLTCCLDDLTAYEDR